MDGKVLPCVYPLTAGYLIPCFLWRNDDDSFILRNDYTALVHAAGEIPQSFGGLRNLAHLRLNGNTGLTGLRSNTWSCIFRGGLQDCGDVK